MLSNFWKHRKDKSLIWSSNPGCFERHLQLRYCNPIFPESLRSVTQDELAIARAKDIQETNEFGTQFSALMHEVASLGDKIPYAEVAGLRKRIDDLLDQAAQLGASAAEGFSTLTELRSLLTDETYVAFARDEIKEGYIALQRAEQFNRAGRKIFRSPFVAQINRIPADELVPRLLSEDVDTIRDTIKALDQKAVYALQAASIERFEQIMQEIGNLDNPLFDVLFVKLEAMGIDLDKHSKMA